jgi:hypothetical protein
MQASNLRIPRPSKPSITRRPLRSRPGAEHPAELTADAVVAYLTKLSREERAKLLERVEPVAARRDAPEPEPEPAPEVTKEVDVPVICRQTLNSADLEVLAEESAAKHEAPPAPPSRSSSVPPPLPERARVSVSAPVPRESVPDATDILFEAMHELSFFETAVEGGSFCLVTALRAVPCLAGIVHLFHAETREYVAVYAQGPRSERVLLTRRPDNDPLLARAGLKRAPVVVEYGVDGAPPVAERHALFGDPWNVLVVPVVHGGRVLAAIELVDPIDGAPFGDVAVSALRYVAEKYGEFLAERGVVLGSVVPPSTAEIGAP